MGVESHDKYYVGDHNRISHPGAIPRNAPGWYWHLVNRRVSVDTVLISMVGHQALPNLLTIQYLKPTFVILLHSAAPDVLQRKHFLVDLLPQECREIPSPGAVDPWDIRSIPQMLPSLIRRRKLDQMDLLLDLTGGTKAMSLGLAHAAQQLPNAKMIYVESAQGDSILYFYEYNDRKELQRDAGKTLPELLTLDMFFRVYQGDFDTSPKSTASPDSISRMFEDDVAAQFAQLRSLEIMRSVRPAAAEEIDITMRYRNQVAIVECKTGKKGGKLDGVMQLSNLASDRYLGTYTRKILAVQAVYSEKADNLEVARRHDVFVLELPEWNERRERDGLGKMKWEPAEVEAFQKALSFAFGPETKESS